VTGTASSAAISQQTPSAASAVKAPDRGERVASGTALQAALAAGDPAAAYELGCRFAEGRGGGVNIQQATMWFDRAAKAGSIPALFRLGTFYEKGDGVARDLQEARRLYLAAAEKGHAKAMHNLAVLYANGIDGKPDYATAALWFRKAASYAVADSEYNLGVLYARGIGVEQNLAESFKWFALAAAQGDQEAAKKRDDVASHLDGPILDVARFAVETFVAETQPASATVGPPPSGGWDQVISGVPKAKPPSRVTVPQPRLTSLEPVFPFGGEH
jgi:localization factor PodJL